MPIYISKNALGNSGTQVENINANNPKYPPLQFELFANVEYLQQLNLNPLYIKPLYKNQETSSNLLQIQLAIKALKTGLNILADVTNFDLPNNQFLNVQSGKYDEEIENAVSAFQSYATVSVTGVMDVETLRLLDKYLILSVKDAVFEDIEDALNYIGAKSKVTTTLATIDIQNNQYIYTITTKKEGGETILITSNEYLSFKLIEKEDENIFENNSIPFFADAKTKEQIPSNIPDSNVRYLVTEGIRFLGNNGDPIPFDSNNFINDINKTPPQLLSDNQVKKYLVSPTDSLLSIIQSSYYNGSSEDILDPYSDPNDVIFTLPQRQLSPANERSKDARFQFYINLIYYYNTFEVDGQIDESYGIKSIGNYQRFDPVNLDQYYIFDNAFNPNDTNTLTVLPNYYRFLEAQRINGTEILFDSNGSPTNIVCQPGKYLWIPSKRYSDSLYYSLNFRHFEMLEAQTNGESDFVNSVATFLNNIQQTNFFNTLSNWFKDEILELYEETLSFFKAAYNFLIFGLTKFWPRGTGGYLSGDVGVTWGIPVTTDLAGEWQMWRKMSKHNQLTIMIKQEAEIKIGAELVEGFRWKAGRNMGNGSKRKPLAVAGYGLGANVGLKTNFTYEFPIRPNEPALISAMIAATANSTLRLSSEVLTIFDIYNISPRNYMTELRLGVSINGNAWGGGQVAFVNGTEQNDSSFKLNRNVDSAQLQNKKKNFTDIENIWSYLFSGGLLGDINVSLGSEFAMTLTYDQQAPIPEAESRVPKSMGMEMLFFAEGSMNIGALGDIIKRFFLNTTINGLNVLPNFFGQNKGYSLSLNFNYERPTAPRNLTAQDIDITSLNINTASVQNTLGRMDLQNKPWQLYLKFGTYTGNPDKLCVNGTKSMISLDTYKLYELIKNAINFDATLQNVVDVFYSYEYQYKMGGGSKPHSIKSFASSIFTEFDGSGGSGFERLEQRTKRELFHKSGEKRFGLSYGAGVNVQLQFVISDIIEIVRYYVKRHYLFYGSVNPILYDQQIIILEKESKILQQNPNQQLPCSTLHSSNYTELNAYLDNNFSAELSGANFLEQLQSYSEIFKQFHQYIRGEESIDLSKLGVQDIIKTLTDMAQLFNATVAIEGKIGLQGGIDIKAGGGPLAGRIALGGEVALMDNTLLMENGNLLQLENDDPLKLIYGNIKKLLKTSQTALSEDGIRKSIFKISSIS